LRDGEYGGQAPLDELSRERMIEMMVGRKIEEEFPKRTHEVGQPRLVVENLCRGGAVCNVSFEVRRGEVLGMTGLVGAGRTETVRLIFGADAADSATLYGQGFVYLPKIERRRVWY
jgi:ABC-type sugar transport system ATPase subunit